MSIVLRHGPYQDVLADVGCDLVLTDGPYSPRVHSGHDDGAELANRKGRRIARNGHAAELAKTRRPINYPAWTAEDVRAFVDFWAPRNRGWFVCLSDSELCPAYRAAYERHGLTGFQPIPIVIPGMTVRMSGDGPSSWAVYANVARPKYLHDWGTLPGAYVVPPGQHEKPLVVGGKPLWVGLVLVRDYSRPGDVVVDACAGGATFLIAAAMQGRQAVGAERDADNYAIGSARIARGWTEPLPFTERAEPEQQTLEVAGS